MCVCVCVKTCECSDLMQVYPTGDLLDQQLDHDLIPLVRIDSA